MSANPEPLAAIFAEMRNPPHKWEGFSRADLADLADRIEAAVQRFVADNCAKCAHYHAATISLKDALAMAPSLGGFEEPVDGDSSAIYQGARYDGKKFLGKNCDVGTAQEQIDRFHEFCHSNRYYVDEFHGYDCRPDCPIGKIVDRDNKFCDNCWAAWAQMPFVPAKGGAE